MKGINVMPDEIPPTDEAPRWWCTGCGRPRRIGVTCACGWYAMQSNPKEIDNG